MSARARASASFVLSIAVVLGSLCQVGAEPQANGLPAPLCSRPLEQEAARVQRLVEALAQSRAGAQRNPLLLADVGYYEAELASSRGCMQSVAAR
jgi:hypothetical protein